MASNPAGMELAFVDLGGLPDDGYSLGCCPVSPPVVVLGYSGG
jgi:hypothetical protein